MASDYAGMVSGQPLAEGTDMSTTAELRELTSQLAQDLAASPYAVTTRRLVEVADAIAGKLEAVHMFVNEGFGPAVAAACAPRQVDQPLSTSPLPSA